jgi:hypothetical protein
MTEPTLDVERAGALCGLGRSKAYSEAARFLATNGAEGLPVLRFGRTLRVPTQRLLELLGLDASAHADDGQRVQLPPHAHHPRNRADTRDTGHRGMR